MNKELIKKRFSKNLDTYNDNASIQKRMAEHLISFLDKRKFPGILEIGCGTGVLTELAFKNLEFETYTANDIVDECEKFIKKISAKIDFVPSDIEIFLKNNQKKYDLIISNAVFQWIENYEEFINLVLSKLNRGGIQELILIDINKDKTIGEEMDLAHGLPYAPQKMIIRAGDYDECKDAQVVVITAGIAQKPGQTRLELAEVNAKIMKDITKSIMASGFNGIIVVASNPVDLMTYVVAKVSGLPKNQVIGSGTVLDTARLRYIVGQYLKISSKNIHAYIMGEHGDSSFVPWEHCYVGCKKITDVMKDNHHPMDKLNKMHEEVVNAAYEIIEKKKATYYGIGMALNRLVRAILDDENSILTVSTYLDNQYGQDDIYIGIPAIINKNGVRELVNLELNEKDQEKLNNSCKVIKEMREQSIDKIINEQ